MQGPRLASLFGSVDKPRRKGKGGRLNWGHSHLLTDRHRLSRSQQPSAYPVFPSRTFLNPLCSSPDRNHPVDFTCHPTSPGSMCHYPNLFHSLPPFITYGPRLLPWLVFEKRGSEIRQNRCEPWLFLSLAMWSLRNGSSFLRRSFLLCKRDTNNTYLIRVLWRLNKIIHKERRKLPWT